MEPNKNESESLNPYAKMQKTSQLPNYQTQNTMPNMQGTMAYQVIYPEIFYRLQPYIIMVCDQMETFQNMMPTQQTIENISDNIYDDVKKMYPDMVEYANQYDKKGSNETSQTDQYGIYDRDYRMYDYRRRNRGMLRDLIDILLLQEFFRRRRRIYY